MTTLWFEFLLCLLLIGIAGFYLSKYGDVIADKTGVSATWVGLVLLATVTSLPELVAGGSAVIFAEAPDIAVGEVLGSCVFNLLIIVVLDYMHREESVYTRASHGHILSAGFGIVLLGIVGINIILASHGVELAIGHVGLYSVVILVLYVIAMRTVFIYEKGQVVEFAETQASLYPDISLSQALSRYLLAAVVVVAAGTWLPMVAKELALAMAWNQSFVGTLFVAFVTSVPELVVTLTAMRIGALDMAIANLFGSNLFNVVVLVVEDFLYLPSPILSSVGVVHSVSVMSAMMMTGLAIVGLLYRPKTRVLKALEWVSILLLVIYVINSYVLYLYGN